MNRREFIKKALLAVVCAKAGKLLADDKSVCASNSQNLNNSNGAELSEDSLRCVGCQCCCPCPAGVDIPRVFELYNAYKKSGDEKTFLSDYGKLSEDEKASACVNCERCLKLCPQKINIPKVLSEIANKFG